MACESDSHDLQYVSFRRIERREGKLYPELHRVETELNAYDLQRFLEANKIVNFWELRTLTGEPSGWFSVDCKSERVQIGTRCRHDAEVVRVHLEIARNFTHAR